MKPAGQLIDFSELVSNVPGEGLEELVRHIARRKGLIPAWSGRGPDGGRDLLLTEILQGPLTQDKLIWLVSCKDKADSGASVTERDLPVPGVIDKLAQHKAQGFFLVTTTTLSTGAKTLLDSLDVHNNGQVYIAIWDSSELTALLIQPEFEDILKQFLPESYKRVKGLTSLEGALLAFRDSVPSDTLDQIMALLKASITAENFSLSEGYGDFNPTEVTATQLIINHSSRSAALISKNISFSEIMAIIEPKIDEYERECKQFLIEVIYNHEDEDVRRECARFLLASFEVRPSEKLNIMNQFQEEDILDLLEDEIASFVEYEYDASVGELLRHSLKKLPKNHSIENINTSNISIRKTIGSKVYFSGDLGIYIIVQSKRSPRSYRVPGKFSGYMDDNGLFLDTIYSEGHK